MWTSSASSKRTLSRTSVPPNAWPPSSNASKRSAWVRRRRFPVSGSSSSSLSGVHLEGERSRSRQRALAQDHRARPGIHEEDEAPDVPVPRLAADGELARDLIVKRLADLEDERRLWRCDPHLGQRTTVEVKDLSEIELLEDLLGTCVRSVHAQRERALDVAAAGGGPQERRRREIGRTP